jgi:hypothetical protein
LGTALLARPRSGDLLTSGGAGGPAAATTPGTAPAPSRPRWDLIVFLQPTATSDQIEMVRRELEGLSEVRTPIAFVDQRQASQEFDELFRDSPEIVDSVRPQVLPTSFRLDLGGDPAGVERLRIRVRTLPGVLEVITNPGGDQPSREAYEGLVFGEHGPRGTTVGP